MSRWSRAAALVLCLLAPALAEADLYSEFRIPDHHWRTKSFAATARFRQSDASTSWGQQDDSSADFGLNGGATWERDSDLLRHRFDLKARVSEASSRRETHQVTPAAFLPPSILNEERDQKDRRTFWSEAISGGFALRAHPTRLAWGIESSANGLLGMSHDDSRAENGYLQIGSVSSIRGRDRYVRRSRQEVYLISMSLGVGLGRTRDATDVYRALLLIGRLRTDGELRGEPSAPAMLRLAQLLGLSQDYGVPHDLPQKAFWRDVEAMLVSEGLIKSSGLDAYALQHALEPVVVAGDRIRRTVGWWVAPTVFQFHERRVRSNSDRSFSSATFDDTLTVESESESSTWRQSDFDETTWGLVAEFHRPLGLQTQLDVQGSASFSERAKLSEGLYGSDVALEHLVDERWFAWIRASHRRQAMASGSSPDGWLVNTSAGIRYYLEDRWNLELRFDHGQSKWFGSFGRSSGLSLLLQYDRGALDAPGLIDPVRSLN